MPQLNLNFIDIPIPETCLWEQFDDEQKQIAMQTIAHIEDSGRWPGTVVTEVNPAGEFWEAEPEHQNYLQRYPSGYTCHYIRPEWTLPNRNDGAGAGAATAEHAKPTQ